MQNTPNKKIEFDALGFQSARRTLFHFRVDHGHLFGNEKILEKKLCTVTCKQKGVCINRASDISRSSGAVKFRYICEIL